MLLFLLVPPLRRPGWTYVKYVLVEAWILVLLHDVGCEDGLYDCTISGRDIESHDALEPHTRNLHMELSPAA